MSTTSAALQHLRTANDSLVAAYAEIMHALLLLRGARKNRAAEIATATEIATHLNEVIDHLDQLLVMVEGDLTVGQ
jgi:hypothetical protein